MPWPSAGSAVSSCTRRPTAAACTSVSASRRRTRCGWKGRRDDETSRHMKHAIAHVALVVRDYDEAIAFYTTKLGFALVEDTYQPEQNKRWVVVAPAGSTATTLLLARATTPEQERCIGNQTGGRVFLFLRTDDFWRDYRRMVA